MPESSLQFSRLGIGTVQFGADYGVNNRSGQVPYAEVLKILEIAHGHGINFLDTARFYGTSETVLGRAFRDLDLQFLVSTKLDLPRGFEELPDRRVAALCRECLRRSLEALGMSTVTVYLLHQPGYKSFRDGLIWNTVLEDQTEGLLRYPGVSVSIGPEEAADCLQDDTVAALQIPYNVFDQRWTGAGLWQRCTARQVLVFSRSTYLQGLLLMDVEAAAEKVPPSRVYKQKLHEIADRAGMELKELTLRYALTQKVLTSTLIGLDSAAQFRENLDLLARGPLEVELVSRIEQAFRAVPDDVIIPARWNVDHSELMRDTETPR
jgi:aryl-alcohol dehydrogenase-like predicted oxidoreductase